MNAMKKMYDSVTVGMQTVRIEVSLEIVPAHPDTVCAALTLPGMCRPNEVKDLSEALWKAHLRSEELTSEFRRLYNIPETTKTFLGQPQ